MIQKDIEQILSKNLFGYQKAVNEDRAVPDSRTGLKPVHTRILYGCYVGGYLSNKEYKKSARIVGDVIGKFHPHGDTSVYDAMVRLAQPWKMRYPLIDLYGNMGNVGGDGPAAMRYTNARLAKLAEDGLLCNMKKNNVDYIPNYDEDEMEAKYLPSLFPNILCNPNEGIGWAMASEWLPHNFNEVYEQILVTMDGGEPMLLGPDFPLGGMIINAKDMEKCYKTGKGTVRIRGKYEIEKNDIVFYEIPYGTTIEGLMEKIITVAKSDIPEIRGVVNESDKKIRLVIKCEKNAPISSIVSKLFAKTPLQTTASFNQVALVDGKPKLINLKETIEIYIKHNIDCIIREAMFDKEKAEARLHIVEGLIKALEDIDNIIALIKQSNSAAAAKEALMEKYKFTEIQAKAILDMKLSKLAKLEKVELEQERDELTLVIKDLNELLSSKERQNAELKSRLSTLVKKYGDARRTELTNIEIKKEEKEIAEVIPEDVVVVMTKSGLIKKVPTSSFKVQKKGGKGVKSNDDILLDIIKTNTIDVLMFFTNKGKMYRTIVDNVPTGTNVSKGTIVRDLIKIDKDEEVIAISSLHRKSVPQYIIFVTKNGMVKKSYLKEYTETNRNTGIAAINIKEGDEVKSVLFQDEENMMIFTKDGMSIHFETKGIAPIGRTAAGVKGIKLNDEDEVVGALSVHKMTDYVALFNNKGLGKKVAISEFSCQGRGGKGVQVYRDGSKLVGVAMVDDEDTLLLSGGNTSICISASELPLLGRTAAGNVMMKTNLLVKVSKI